MRAQKRALAADPGCAAFSVHDCPVRETVLPGAIQDCDADLAWRRANTMRLSNTLNNFIVFGESNIVGLSAAAASTGDRSGLPPYDLSVGSFGRLMGEGVGSAGRLARASASAGLHVGPSVLRGFVQLPVDAGVSTAVSRDPRHRAHRRQPAADKMMEKPHAT
jgi:hypothetical protein